MGNRTPNENNYNADVDLVDKLNEMLDDKSKVQFTDKVNAMLEETSKNVVIPYEKLPQYDLFLSQVIDYLNDSFENEKYTNNIVQNYIKSEVISKPEDGKKRGYTKLHLVQLVLLSYMRPVLTTEEIKQVFKLAFNDINDRSDDIITWESAYKIFTKIQEKSVDSMVIGETGQSTQIKDVVAQMKLNAEDEERISVFILVLTLIAQSSTIKKMAQKIVKGYTDN